MSSGNIRIKGEDHRTLEEMQDHFEVKKIAVEEGVIDSAQDDLSFRDVCRLIVPEDADPVERPEDDMQWQNAGDMKEVILNLAGENVSVHEVVTVFTEEFIEEYNIEVNHE